MEIKERINQRFAKDFNLPINIFGEDMFEYYHQLYADFWPEEEWQALQKEISEEFNGNMELWLETYSIVRDRIICTLESSEAYKKFNSLDLNQFAVDERHRNLPDRNIFNAELDGKMFVSIDLRKANFQALKFAGVIDKDSYETFIEQFNKSFYFKKSKYTRQVIFGKLNPRRQITIEHYLMGKVLDIKFESIENQGGKIVAFKSDELIWQINDIIPENELQKIEDIVKEQIGIDVKAECFTIHKLPIHNSRGNEISAYVKKNLNTAEEKLKSVSAIYFPQVYKLYKGLEINELDRQFYYEDQIAVFKEPLKIKK